MHDKLLSKISVSTTTGCWNWSAGKIKAGYGYVWDKTKNRRAHRVSYEVFNGEITEDLYVLHKCDNPSCINPEHLFLGTPKHNMEDKLQKGRGARGSQQGSSKLIEEDIPRIRLLCKQGELSLQEIGNIFNVGYTTIHAVKSRQNWRHIV